MRVTNVIWWRLLLTGAFCCAARICFAGPEPIVEVPTGAQMATVEIPTEGQMAGEYKSTKTVEAIRQPEPKWWSITAEVGYSSEYIFRGTNLATDSDGLEYQQVYFSAKGFTLGVWFATQIGRATVPGATAVGESGAGRSPFNIPGVQEDVAVQSEFKELDIISSYSHTFGLFDVTFGNIAFFIFRSAVDNFYDFTTAPTTVTPFGVPENEQFDRLFLSLSSRNFHVCGAQVIPTVTYYQTIYNHADSIRTPKGGFGPSNGGPGFTPQSQKEYELQNLGFIRNDRLGGYIEGKVTTVIPIIENVLRIESTELISISAGDRSHAVPKTSVPFFIATNMIATSSSEPYYGFYHFQSGTDVVLQIASWLSVSGFSDYAHHLAHTVAGTERNEWWGGGRVTVSF